jgi:PAS domain S-box-containing protein
VAAGRGVLPRRPTRVSLRRVDFWLGLAAVCGAYVVTARFGINLSVAHGVITPVWAPSGVALAALLIFGRGLWPAVWLGAFLANATSGVDPPVAAAIAVGNTLEAVVAVWFLRRVGFRIGLGRVQDVLAFVAAAGLGTLVAATNGVTVLSLADARVGSYGSDWLLWWFGDAVGVLMVTPILLVASVQRRKRPETRRLLEGLLVLGLLIGLSATVFLAGGWRYPYLLFALLLWAVLRFRQLGAAASSFVVGLIATVGTMTGAVPIAGTDATTRVQIIQALVGLLAVSLLVVGATLVERETANEAVRQTADRLAEAQALTHIGSWEWDIATDRIDWSDELYRIFGLAPHSIDLTYEAIFERVHPDDRARVDAALRRAYADRVPVDFEHRIVAAEGDVRVIHGHGRVLADGSSARMVGTARDITEQTHALNLRNDILSTVSHELRTPLASILGFSSILRERGENLSDRAVAGLVDKIVVQGRRLDRILSDLLDVDRLRHGLVVPERAPTDVRQLVEQIAAAHQVTDRTISVSAQPTTADVDSTKFERIVDNLVANAVRHTPPGTPIYLRLEAHDQDLLLVVDDNGPGIPDELKTAVFEIFDRGAQQKSNVPGTGIGLSLVGRFAALHGGRAWVEDSQSGGASFRVSLPDCVLAGPSPPTPSE